MRPHKERIRDSIAKRERTGFPSIVGRRGSRRGVTESAD
jgi:hypothetical protein